MAWDGNGAFSRTNGTQTGATTWANARDAGNKITASQHDTHDQDIADGIGACLTKNNESKPTATFKPNADATYDLGSSALRWKDLYLSGNIVSAGTLAVQGAFSLLSDTSPSQITANQNDYNPTGLSTTSVLRINSDARRSLTGLAGGSDGRVIQIHNVGTFPILFKFEDSNSSAANRFAFGHTLSGQHTMTIQYDSTSTRWRCIAKEEPAGTLKDFAGTTVPEGYLARDGSNVSRTTYASLFNEVGTTWGVGDGSTTFGLGDDRRRVAVGVGGSGTATLANTVGSTGGAETHALVTGELASHTHGFGGTVMLIGGAFSEQGVTGSVSHATDTAAAGSGTAHNNMQPSYVVTKIIKF